MTETPTVATKRCPTCKQIKPRGDFWTNNSRPDRLQSQCKQCHANNKPRKPRKLTPEQKQRAAERQRQRLADPAARDAQRESKRRYKKRLAARTPEQIAADRLRHHPEGTKDCGRCHKCLPLSAYAQNRTEPDALQTYCTACRTALKGLRSIAAPHWSATGIDASKCFYCGGPADSIDHLTPLALGGLDVGWNLVPACCNCNNRKGTKPALSWLAELEVKTA